MKGIPFKSKQTPQVMIEDKLSYEELIATYFFTLNNKRTDNSLVIARNQPLASAKAILKEAIEVGKIKMKAQEGDMEFAKKIMKKFEE